MTEKYIEIYKNGLLNDIVPFWTKYGVDNEYGGFMSCLDRNGAVIDTDKGIWQNGRFTWMYATLYNEVEQRQEWLDLAKHGVDFLDKYGFDTDGRMFFVVDRKGNPIRKRRYVYSESFAAIAYASYYKATGMEEYAQKARDCFDIYYRYTTTPNLVTPKYTDTRKTRSMGIPMIGIATAQELRKNLNDNTLTQYIDTWIDEIKQYFINEEYKAVMELVGENGEFIDHFDGRTLNPGHAIEGSWFILREATLRNNDPDLINMGLKMLDWMWKRGWDELYGGFLSFVDVKGLPVQEYWHEMKFWWPHCEAIIATLMAYELTGDYKYKRWHMLVHDWAFNYFRDESYGEWYGYLNRDGRVSLKLKGNIWKGFFHIPRMHMFAWQICERINNNSSLTLC